MLPNIALLEFENAAAVTDPAVVHKTYAWDFESGDFKQVDGRLIEVTGLEYLQVWIRKALMTSRDNSIYYGTSYGSEHYSLIGKNLHPDYSRSEYERMIREVLLDNDAISQVDNFAFAQEGSKLIVSFDVASIYGLSTEAVNI